MDLLLVTRLESHAKDLNRLADATASSGLAGTPVSHHVSPTDDHVPSELVRVPRSMKSSPSLATLVEEDDEDGSARNMLSSSANTSGKKLVQRESENREKAASLQPQPARIPPTKRVSEVLSTAAKSESKSTNVQSLGEPSRVPSRPSWLNLTAIDDKERARVHYEDLWGAWTRNFGKGFVLGVGGKIFINLLYEFAGFVRRRGKPTTNPSSLLSATATLWERHAGWIVDGAQDCGLFLGFLLSTHNSIMFATRSVPKDQARYRGGFAGFVAGLASLWALPQSLRRSVVLFTVVRMVEILFRVAAERKSIPTVEHGDSLLMSVASSFMIYCFVYHPQSLDPAYVAFLTRQSQFSPAIVKAVGQLQAGVPIAPLDKVNASLPKTAKPITDALGYDSPSLSAAQKGAFLLHPGQSFPIFAAKYLARGLTLALPVYTPVYLFPIVTLGYKRMLAQPVGTLRGAAEGIARSSAFLATYCALGICTLSIGRTLGVRYDVLGSFAKVLPAGSGTLAGLATMIEKKNRRIELALYVLSKALEGLIALVGTSSMSVPRLTEDLAFAVSLSIIMHANVRYTELIRPVYRNNLHRFFDTDERHDSFLR